MRFIEIPRDLLPQGARLVNFGPVPGHEHSTGSLSVAVEGCEEYGAKLSFLIEFDDEDLVALAKSRRLWIHQFGSSLQPVACGPIASELYLDGPLLAGKYLCELSYRIQQDGMRLAGDGE